MLEKTFQIIASIGIICVSAACLAYTWRTIESHRLRRTAAVACRAMMGKENDPAEQWIAVQGCINNVLGVPSFDGSGIESAIRDLQYR